jgi:mediator of RNA polymerase II transcription subunit 13
VEACSKVTIFCSDVHWLVLQPPDTAESQALMFSLPDYGEVTQTPGTAPLMDASDPMVLPILDFPLLEMNQNMDILSDMKPVSSMDVSQGLIGGFASPPRSAPALNLRLKSEALLCFASGFEPVDMSGVPDVGMGIVRYGFHIFLLVNYFFK